MSRGKIREKDIFFGSYGRENKISRGCRTLTPHLERSRTSRKFTLCPDGALTTACL
jgi:hypothetical protein